MKLARAVLGVLGGLVLGTLAALAFALFRPHLWLWDTWTLHALQRDLAWECPDAERIWKERHQTGSSGASLYAFALVEPAPVPASVQVLRLVDGQVVVDEGLYEGQIYDPDCYACAVPRSAGLALLAHPDREIWSLHRAATWFD